MDERLPHGDEAIVDRAKIEAYCLNEAHPRGRHKARVFRAALGIGQSDAAWLTRVFLDAARSALAHVVAEDGWGTQWRVDTTVSRHGRSAVVRTAWIVRRGETRPRFVTAWVL